MRPLEKYRFAESAVAPGDIADVTGSVRTNGYPVNAAVAHEHLNYLLNALGEWIAEYDAHGASVYSHVDFAAAESPETGITAAQVGMVTNGAKKLGEPDTTAPSNLPPIYAMALDEGKVMTIEAEGGSSKLYLYDIDDDAVNTTRTLLTAIAGVSPSSFDVCACVATRNFRVFAVDGVMLVAAKSGGYTSTGVIRTDGALFTTAICVTGEDTIAIGTDAGNIEAYTLTTLPSPVADQTDADVSWDYDTASAAICYGLVATNNLILACGARRADNNCVIVFRADTKAELDAVLFASATYDAATGIACEDGRNVFVTGEKAAAATVSVEKFRLGYGGVGTGDTADQLATLTSVGAVHYTETSTGRIAVDGKYVYSIIEANTVLISDYDLIPVLLHTPLTGQVNCIVAADTKFCLGTVNSVTEPSFVAYSTGRTAQRYYRSVATEATRVNYRTTYPIE
jgi:hypothetical protein